MAGGFGAWKAGYPTQLPRDARRRAARPLQPPPPHPRGRRGGQVKLLDSKVLLIGAGGLGSPAALYLAAAGVGTIGIVDADRSTPRTCSARSSTPPSALGQRKIESAQRDHRGPEPRRRGRSRTRSASTSENVERIIADGYDVIVDGADNFPTRYLLNDAAVARQAGRPRRDLPLRGPGDGVQAVRRPVLPLPLPGAAAPGTGALLRRGRRARRPARGSSACCRRRRRSSCCWASASRWSGGCCSSTPWRPVPRAGLRRDPNCPVCGEHPTVTEFIDYDQFCYPKDRKSQR